MSSKDDDLADFEAEIAALEATSEAKSADTSTSAKPSPAPAVAPPPPPPPSSSSIVKPSGIATTAPQTQRLIPAALRSAAVRLPGRLIGVVASPADESARPSSSGTAAASTTSSNGITELGKKRSYMEGPGTTEPEQGATRPPALRTTHSGVPGFSGLMNPMAGSGPGPSIIATSTTPGAFVPPSAPVPTHLSGQVQPSRLNARARAQVSSDDEEEGEEKDEKRVHLRIGAGMIWNDPTMDDWPEDGFRIFVGNLGNDSDSDMLAKCFRHYPSFQMARVIRKKGLNNKSYGFVSFADPMEMVRSMREMEGKYCGNRPMVIKKCESQQREFTGKKDLVKKKKGHHIY